MSDAEQGSAAWLMSRCGYVTCSRFRDVVGKQKSGKPLAARETYLMELVVERLTGMPSDHYTSVAMEWGISQEGHSRMAYEAAEGVIVEETGFIKFPALPWVGGSPDGLVGDDGLWESKSPYNSAVQLYTWLEGVPEEHTAQIQGLLWITGRKWCGFQSFDPRLPEPLNRFCKRVERNDAYIRMLEAEIRVFADEVEERVQQLLKTGAQP